MSPTPRQPPVIVGVDAQPPSRVALDWAIEEAARRKLPLHILHADPVPSNPRLRAPAIHADVRASAVMADAVARARGLFPWLDVTSEVSSSQPSIALVDASHLATCIIVGARGRSPLVGALLGTTSADVATRAACPVVVVRQFPKIEPQRPGVVVGADGSELSTEAVGYAFAQAADRQLPLTVVHVCSAGADGVRLARPVETHLSALVAQEQALAAEEVAGWAQKCPDVLVHRHVRRGHPLRALVAESRGAELLVVGSRGLGGFAGMLLGSVSQGVLQHAHCPVAIVRQR